MTTDANPRAIAGDNQPPEDAKDALIERLEELYGELLDEAADLELAALKLPERPESDEDCAQLIDFAAKAKELAKKAENIRVEEKKPYLDNGRKVDGFFEGVRTPVEQRITAVTGRINTYQRAKAEREAAERREQERQERERAEEARRREEESRRLAEEAEEASRAAAASIRSAADAEEREEAERRMREESQRADEARREAEEAAKEGAKAVRVADAAGKAATGGARLGKVTAGGASAGASTFWNHRIMDADALLKSLGSLGPYLSNDAIMQAINLAKRTATANDTIATLTIPGVEFFEDTRTNIRTKKS